MFCPNCGSKNEDSAARCAQCGFEIQAAKPSPRFKGTMVMQAPVVAPPAGSGSPAPAPGPAAGARPSPLKGTMVGVAPPGMDDLRRQIAESRAAAAASPKVAGPFSTQTTPATPAARMKGTMIGLAPPSGGDELGQATMLGVAPQASVPPGDVVRPGAVPPMSRPMPSQLKGTMIGAAGVDPALLQPKATQPASSAPQGVGVADALGGTMLAGAGPAGAGPAGAGAPGARVAPATDSFGATQPMPQVVTGQAWSPPHVEQGPGLGSPSGAAPLAAVPLGALPVAGAPRTTSAAPPEKSNLAMVVLIALVVVLAIALVGIGMVMRNKKAQGELAPSGVDTPAAR